MKKLIGLMTALLICAAYVPAAQYTVRLITAKPETSHVANVFLTGNYNNWSTGGSAKQMAIEEISENTITWTYTYEKDGGDNDFKFFINQRYSYDRAMYTNSEAGNGNFTFTPDPAASENIMTIDATSYVENYHVIVYVTAPDCTDQVWLIGGWGGGWDLDRALPCHNLGNNLFMGAIPNTSSSQYEFKCYNRAGWDYEEKIESSDECVNRGDGDNRSSGTNATLTINNICDWKHKAYTCPENIGDVTLTITAPEGTDKVYLVGNWGTGWNMDEAIECTHVSGTTFTAVVPNIESVKYKCYNRKQRNGRTYWGYVETHDNCEVDNRTLRFVDGAEQSITIEDWMNKGWLESDFTVTITAPNCTNNVYIIGNWGFENGNKETSNGHKWRTGDAVQATNIGDNVFQATFAATSATRFKCYNKADWGYVEKQADASTDIIERTTAESSITVARWQQKDYNGCVTVTITTPPGTEEVWMTGASGADSWGNWSLSNAKECTKIGDRTFQYTITNISGNNVQFRCLNKNIADGNGEWIYEQNEENWSVSKNDADTKAITIASWKTPYRVGYSDHMNNDVTSAFYDDQTVNVVLTGRTLTSASYNTLCLPFDLATLTGTPLEGADLKALDRTEQVGDELQLYFADATSITAGKPYLVQPTSSLVEPVFEGVFISNDVVASYDEATGIRFQGILNPTHLPSTRNILFLGADNELFWPSDDGTSMPGMRAYFQLDGGPSSAPVRRVRIVQAPQTVTELESIPTPIKSQKMIENGVLLIQRDGVKYDVLGQQVR